MSKHIRPTFVMRESKVVPPQSRVLLGLQWSGCSGSHFTMIYIYIFFMCLSICFSLTTDDTDVRLKPVDRSNVLVAEHAQHT